MIAAIHPKLPMRDKSITTAFYVGKLGFVECGDDDYMEYLMLQKDKIEIHFFLYKDLNIKENYGQVYLRTDDIQKLYNEFIKNGITIHPNGTLQLKPWGQLEFSILDPDNNLLTFGEAAI